MKSRFYILCLAGMAAAVTVVGCSQPEKPAGPAAAGQAGDPNAPPGEHTPAAAGPGAR